MNMRLAFLGTPEFVIPVLSRLVKEGHEIVRVVTASAKPVGRGQKVSPAPVARWAKKRGFKVITPEKLGRLFVKSFAAEELDVAVVAAYGKILPAAVLAVPKYGFLNVHPSLLPLYRGPSPVAGAMVAGEKETGVTIMKVDEEMDHGPIGEQTKIEIQKQVTGGELTDKLFKLGAEKLVEVLRELIIGRAKWVKQNHKKAVYTRRLRREDGFLPWEWLVAAGRGEAVKKIITPPPLLKGKYEVTPKLIYNLVRGLSPWPGAWTRIVQSSKFKGQSYLRVKILGARLDNGRLMLETVQVAGKKPVSYGQFKEVYGKLGK